MTDVRALAVVLLLTAAPAQAQSPQVWQTRPGAAAFDYNRYQADRHRYEMDRLRFQADQREAFARQQEMESRLNRQRLEFARRPDPIYSLPLRTLGSPEQERARRVSAEERGRALTDGVSQIDAWLDRPAD